jgi:hypothetical protein
MIRCIFVILLVMSGFLSLEAQIPSKQDDFPSVSVLLPANIPSETVQISYFLIGPFGGYGGYTKQRPGLHSYEISALVEGKTASEIRMIVYASGCEIKTFVLALTEDSRVKQEFECQRVATVKLSGQIVPTELVRKNNAELVVNYMAYWAHGFFGIADGLVTEFRLATVSPDANGVFQLSCPISAPTMKLLLPDEERAFGSCFATQKPGTTSPLIWNLRCSNFGSKSTACESGRIIPTVSNSQPEHCSRT